MVSPSGIEPPAPAVEAQEPQPLYPQGSPGCCLNAVQTLIPLWLLITLGGRD